MLYREGKLTMQNMDMLVNKLWKLAVITIDEDAKLNRLPAVVFDQPLKSAGPLRELNFRANEAASHHHGPLRP